MNITKKKPDYILDHSFEDDEKDLHSPLPDLSLSQAIESIGMGKFQYILLFVVSWNFVSTSFQYILPGLLLPTFFKEFELGSFELSVYGFFEYSAYLSGALLSYLLEESFGRRKMILVTLIFAAIVTALCCLAQSIYIIILLRFLAINALVINYYYTYSFMLELLPQKTKKNLAIYIQIMNSFGTILCIFMVSYVFESLDYGNWQLLMILASMVIWIAFSLNAVILDESPYYNMKKGNSEAAFVVINKIAKFNLKNPEFLNLEKKRMISSWFIKNESNFNLMRKEQQNNKWLLEDRFNLRLVVIWAIDLFVFHGFDFVLPIFLVLQKNAIHPLFQKMELLSYLLEMHLIGCSYVILAFFAEKINFRRKIFLLFLQILCVAASLLMGLNIPPSFIFWMIAFKLLLNFYNFFKMQIVSQSHNEKKGVSLRNVKIYGKIGMVASTFLLVFFLNLNIYVIYFIFAGLFCVNIILWPNVQNYGEIKEEIEKNEMNRPLNREDKEIEFDDIYRIIEVPL